MTPTSARKIIIALAICTLLALAFGVKSYTDAQKRAVEAKAGQARAEGQVKAATDATGLTANAMDAAAASEQLSRESRDVIQSAPGASAPVDPALSAAARKRLCLRAAYRNQPGCAALLKADTGATPR